MIKWSSEIVICFGVLSHCAVSAAETALQTSSRHGGLSPKFAENVFQKTHTKYTNPNGSERFYGVVADHRVGPCSQKKKRAHL